jgi:UDP-N-acetylglucosamine 1-carboxyvinyltransferase
MNYYVTGGKELSGTITTNTSKNSAVSLLCASLLNRGTTTLRRMPRIEEINRLIEVLRSIGVLVEWNDDTLTITPPRELSLNTIDAVAATKTRSIILLAGALAHWETDFVLPMTCNLNSGLL